MLHGIYIDKYSTVPGSGFGYWVASTMVQIWLEFWPKINLLRQNLWIEIIPNWKILAKILENKIVSGIKFLRKLHKKKILRLQIFSNENHFWFCDFRSQKFIISRLNFWITCKDSKKMTQPPSSSDVYG